MLKDIPYSVLKQDERAYGIILFRDQYNNTFKDVAKEFGTSVPRCREIYCKQKIKQISLYVNHIAIVLGYENSSEIRKVYEDAYECYQDQTYACAYLEKQYKDILTLYRAGEPGMPIQFIRSIPPFKSRLNKKTVARIIEMRNVGKMQYVEIAKELHITQQKAQQTYNEFYHQQVLMIVSALQEKVKSEEEKMSIIEYCFRGNKSPKKRYDMMLKELHDSNITGGA